MLCSPANSTAGLRFGGTSESKKPQKIAQSTEGGDKLSDLCEQKIHIHLSTSQRGHADGQDLIMCMEKDNFVYLLCYKNESCTSSDFYYFNLEDQVCIWWDTDRGNALPAVCQFSRNYDLKFGSLPHAFEGFVPTSNHAAFS